MTTIDPYTALLDGVREQLTLSSEKAAGAISKHTEVFTGSPEMVVYAMERSDGVFEAVAQRATAARVIGIIDRGRGEGDNDETLTRLVTSYLTGNLVTMASLERSSGTTADLMSVHMGRARAEVLHMLSMGGFDLERLLGLR